MTRVGLVVVSHSAQLAAGVVEVAAQMAPNVTVVAAGGTDDGGIGTDFDAVVSAIERADGGAGTVVLYDLGSARMVAEMAVETAENARLADAPLVEGAVAAAVAAEGEADVSAVAAAAESAAKVTTEAAPTAPDAEDEVRITLTNKIGLHARPAAVVARAMTGLDATVTVHFGAATADGRSVLALMALGAQGGDEIRVSAAGPQAAEALHTFEELAASNFGE
ncbi:dihydroxyacetone kinase phosphoryl donor subunit DhaM [Actinophytocola oryzae]|uniref:Phosphocarrier protein HPr n=1 Tax=Actinophytocola oryzae TaxID=502181 RepID=A0A4R7VVB5_9PSEU|nr:dihydroxyacetone kinase phosphoryl donor subunit DhaM [Actinophytocola oryzae]TDV53558.1 PTS hybrid protein [Actinophytocola oryzae]